jgi:hypothetical protein
MHARDTRSALGSHLEPMPVIPDARLEWIEGSRSFSPEDRPERLAELIGAFVGVPAAAG